MAGTRQSGKGESIACIKTPNKVTISCVKANAKRKSLLNGIRLKTQTSIKSLYREAKTLRAVSLYTMQMQTRQRR